MHVVEDKLCDVLMFIKDVIKVKLIHNTYLAKGDPREHSEEPWLGQTTDDIVKLQYQAS
jgi:hypothetical protein